MSGKPNEDHVFYRNLNRWYPAVQRGRGMLLRSGSGGSPRRGGGRDGLWIIVGLIVVFGGVIGLAELTGIPLENWSTGIILLMMFLLFLLFGVIILLFY